MYFWAGGRGLGRLPRLRIFGRGLGIGKASRRMYFWVEASPPKKRGGVLGAAPAESLVRLAVVFVCGSVKVCDVRGNE